jgi:hypothetical protein
LSCAKSWEAALVRFMFARPRAGVSVGPGVDGSPKDCASPLLKSEVMPVFCVVAIFNDAAASVTRIEL